MAKKSQLDIFDVVYRFAENPLGCVGNIGARSVLREQDFGWRPWIGKPLDSRRAGPPTPGGGRRNFGTALTDTSRNWLSPALVLDLPIFSLATCWFLTMKHLAETTRTEQRVSRGN
jgi:hypothetical protein